MLVCSSFLFGGCTSIREVGSISRVDSVYVERVVERVDTTILIQPDSAAVRMLLACDSMNNVVLVALSESEGKRLQLETALRHTQQGVAVSVDCKADSMQLVIDRLREVIRCNRAAQTLQKEVVKEKYIPPFFKWCTGLFLGCMAVVVVIIVLRIYYRIRL